MAESGSWCTIESDPGVFTELVENLSVKGVQFEEIWDLSTESMTNLKKNYTSIYGLIFLFKCQSSSSNTQLDYEAYPDDLFYAQQVIGNACASQAILSVLLNRQEIDIGPELKNLKEFSKSFDPRMRGLALGNSEKLRQVHNSFRPVASFEFSENEKSGKEEAFHYISYVPFNGFVYELDGLADGPVCLGKITPSDASNELWISLAINEIKRRISNCQTDGKHNEIKFNLLAVVNDRLMDTKKEILKQKILKQRCNIKCISLGEDIILEEENDDDDAPEGTPNFDELPNDVNALKDMVSQIDQTLVELFSIETNESRRRREWKRDNGRRRHDFIPFLLCSLKHLSKKGLLRDVYKKEKQLVMGSTI